MTLRDQVELGLARAMRGAVTTAEVSVRVATTGIDVALALPRIAASLERLSRSAEDLRTVANAAPAVESVAAVIEEIRRLLTDPAHSDDIQAARVAVRRLSDVTATMGPLAEAIGELNTVVASLTTTVSPLQGASERLGRLVDRIPVRGSSAATAPRRRVVDVDPARD